ncbi:MAG: hypothetical protein HYV09_07640 [Deltaproteobacteria bacterium]|nr:hypothetical protein [Deltaproteobacteria bacterium]
MNKLLVLLSFTVFAAGCVANQGDDGASSSALGGAGGEEMGPGGAPGPGDPGGPGGPEGPGGPDGRRCGPPPCLTDTIGDAKTCVDAKDLHHKAAAFCAAREARLTHFGPMGACAEGSASIAKFTCCRPPPPPGAEPPRPPPLRCHGEITPPSDACVDVKALHDKLMGACRDRKEVLAGFDPIRGECGEHLARGAKFVCCLPPPPPPPPRCGGDQPPPPPPGDGEAKPAPMRPMGPPPPPVEGAIEAPQPAPALEGAI